MDGREQSVECCWSSTLRTGRCGGRSQICRVSHLSVALRLRRMRAEVGLLFQKSFMSGLRSIGRDRKQARVGREVASLPFPPCTHAHTLANHTAPRPQRERGPDIFLHKIRWARPCGEIKFHTRRRSKPCCVQLVWSGGVIFKGAKVIYTIRLTWDLHILPFLIFAPSAMSHDLNLTTPRQMLVLLDSTFIILNSFWCQPLIKKSSGWYNKNEGFFTIWHSRDRKSRPS